eukprot:m.311389 g.311389  ORF g.311389 m.311389 type:complete len:159 (+) comp67654_c0_seq1:88-564(+)
MPFMPLTPLEKLLRFLAEQMTEADFKKFYRAAANMLPDPKPGARRSGEFRSIEELFDCMLRHFIITESTLKYVIELLRKSDRADLVPHVETFISDRKIAEAKAGAQAMMISAQVKDMDPDRVEHGRSLISDLMGMDKSQILWVSSNKLPDGIKRTRKK